MEFVENELGPEFNWLILSLINLLMGNGFNDKKVFFHFNFLFKLFENFQWKFTPCEVYSSALSKCWFPSTFLCVYLCGGE